MEERRGERRLVVVVFADLVGSTQLSGEMDPEDYAEVVVGYQRLAVEVVEKHGGVVQGFAGDGLCSYFGFPRSHADDAIRAVETGRELVERVPAQLGLAVRVGVHAGVTIVLPNPSGEFDLLGQVANVTARVEGAADPNSVAVSQTVVDLLDGAYEVCDPRTPALKGVAEPIAIRTVVGRRRPGDGPESLVGRDAELATLRAALVPPPSGVHLQALVGAAGSGKSSLFRAAVHAARGDGLDVVAVAAHDLDRGVPFQVLRRILQTVVDGEPVRHLPPVLVEVLAGTTPRPGRSGVVAVIDAAGALVAELGPIAIAIEDLQWADPSTRLAIDRLARGEHDANASILVTSRDPVPFAHDELELSDLDDTQIGLLARLAGPSLEFSTIQDIVRRSGGVPLYVVELARAAERGTDPVKVHSSLLTAFDGAGDSRGFAQVAAAVGEAPDPGVLAVLDPDATTHLAALVDAGVMEVHDERVIFRHALIRDEIYSTLLRTERRSIHGRIAEVLGELAAPSAVIAHHHFEATEYLRAARQYSIGATNAAARGATEEAVLLAEAGLDATGKADASREVVGGLELRLTVVLANARMAIDGYGNDDLVELWRRCESLGDEVADRDEQSSGMNGRSLHAFFSGDLDLAAEEATRLLGFAAEHDNRLAHLRGMCSLGLARLHQGRAADALELFRGAADLYQRDDYEIATYGFGTDHLVIAHASMGQCRWLLGDLAAAHADFTAALVHAQALGSHISLALAHMNHAMTLLLNGEVTAAEVPTDALTDVAARYDLAFYRGLAELFRGSIEAQRGDPSGVDRVFGAFGDLTSTGSSVGVPMATLLIARAMAAVGDRDGALGLAEIALQETTSTGEHLVDAELHLFAAEVVDPDARHDRLIRAAAVAEDFGLHWSHLRAVEALAEINPDPGLEVQHTRLMSAITSRTIDPSPARSNA